MGQADGRTDERQIVTVRSQLYAACAINRKRETEKQREDNQLYITEKIDRDWLPLNREGRLVQSFFLAECKVNSI